MSKNMMAKYMFLSLAFLLLSCGGGGGNSISLLESSLKEVASTFGNLAINASISEE